MRIVSKTKIGEILNIARAAITAIVYIEWRTIKILAQKMVKVTKMNS